MTTPLITRLEEAAKGSREPSMVAATMVSEIAAPHIRGAVYDGISLGLKLAVECLETAKPNVAAENQTWDTALALLAILRANHKDKP